MHRISATRFWLSSTRTVYQGSTRISSARICATWFWPGLTRTVQQESVQQESVQQESVQQGSTRTVQVLIQFNKNLCNKVLIQFSFTLPHQHLIQSNSWVYMLKRVTTSLVGMNNRSFSRNLTQSERPNVWIKHFLNTSWIVLIMRKELNVSLVALQWEMSLHFTRFWHNFPEIGIREIFPEIENNIPRN